MGGKAGKIGKRVVKRVVLKRVVTKPGGKGATKNKASDNKAVLVKLLLSF